MKNKNKSITYEDVNAAKARIKENQEKLDQLIEQNCYKHKDRTGRVVPYWLTSKWSLPKTMQQIKIDNSYDSNYNVVWEMVKKRDGTPIKYGPYELSYIADTAFVKFPDGNVYPFFTKIPLNNSYSGREKDIEHAKYAYSEFFQRNNLNVGVQNIKVGTKLHYFVQNILSGSANGPSAFISGLQDNKYIGSHAFSFFKDFMIEVSKDREAILNKRKALMAKISADNNIIKAHQEGVENYQEYVEKKKEKRQEKIEKKLAARSKEEVERLTKLALLISKFKPVMDEIEEGIGNSEYVFNFGNFPHRMRHIENGLKHLEYLTSSVKNKK